MQNTKTDNVLIFHAGVARAEYFSLLYPFLNNHIFNEKECEQSRNGEVKEILDFKTQLLNPYRRCVGGFERDMNIFFLTAEAIWIALGKKDVAFLTAFNKKMEEFSDDGKTFHAPYGYRLRHWGVKTEDSYVDESLNTSKGDDQLIDAIKLFSENPNTRQVVLSVWNPKFDLGYKTKDIPCNDMIMLKIRNGKFITTIQNRSNDLHWGLPTNVFQFSFLTEIMSAALGFELGTQTHNSQSLHIYKWNEVSEKMDKLFNNSSPLKGAIRDMYVDCGAVEKRMDFNCSHELPVNRFREIEYALNIIYDNLNSVINGKEESKDEISFLATFSVYLYSSYQLLKIYLEYKAKLPDLKTNVQKDAARYTAISEIELIELRLKEIGGFGFEEGKAWDVSMLAKNFFASRLSEKGQHEFLGKL